MTLNPIRYVLPAHSLSPRWDRLWAIVEQNVRLRATTGPLLLAGLGFALTCVPLLALGILSKLVPINLLPDAPSTFALDFEGGGLSLILFLFVLLMTTLVGSGIVANDLHSKAISLYLSRPITVLDYLVGKGTVVGIYLSLLCLVPGLLTVVLLSALGYFSATVALQAFGAFLGVGLLMTGFFAGVALFFSSLTHRRAFAGVSIFAVLLVDEIFSSILAGAVHQEAWLYVSPWSDVVTVAQACFSYTPTGGYPIDPWDALGVLLSVGAALYVLVYLRLSRLQVVTD